ncbi:MAG: hypothetical protein ACNS60_01815 [Candidatus Cyclobacteriaceae bacterium M2_1C_046]
MRALFLTLLALFFSGIIFAQDKSQERLNVFIDCSNVWCDMSYIRTEINIINFSLDRIAADVHVLITSQGTGSGGREYQMIFYGQRNYSFLKDTLKFQTGPNATDFERRDEILKHLKIGLVPYLIQTGTIDNLSVNMKASEAQQVATKPVEDPWNYWVFNVGANGSVNEDQVYKSFRFNGDFSINRTTDEQKFYLNGDYGKNKSVYEYNQDGTVNRIEVNNHDFRIRNGWIFSINDHWSYGYEASISRSTFSNNEGRIFFQPAIEYSIFPYREVNNKFFTIRYGVDYWYNDYFETTIYDKDEESLLGHGLEVNISFNQKWGNISSGIDYHNFFHDWSLNNFGLFYNIDIRITGGLSVFTFFRGEIVHDQIYLPKGGATEQEVLTRRRQLESSYNYFTRIGINYRFGSNLNNFVNPRFR